MTPPIDDPEVLRRILANTDALLLDFDGPICSVFSGIPAHIVADQLRDILAEGGHAHFPEAVRTATDPFDILFYAATLGPDEARYIEVAFTAHEVEAIQTAQPTPRADDLMRAWKATGRQLAIVSNNSRNAIEAYLALYNLQPSVDHIAARTGPETSRLKPNPYLITQAGNALTVRPDRCTLIGDSLTDIQAATLANICAIGFANKSRKIDRLSAFGAELLVTSIGEILAGLPAT